MQVIHSKGDDEENEKSILNTASEEEELPPWLSKELREGDYIPMPEKENGGCAASKCAKSQVTPIRGSTTLSTCDKYQKLENSDLLLKIEKLERVNQALTKKIEEQEDVIKALRKQNEIYAENNRKLFELSSKTGPL